MKALAGEQGAEGVGVLLPLLMVGAEPTQNEGNMMSQWINCRQVSAKILNNV